MPLHLDIVSKLINKLVFFDLSYLREMGRGQRWRDNEEVYFVANLLSQLSFAIKRFVQETMKRSEQFAKKIKCTFHENSILSKCTIGIVVPFPNLVVKYEAVINERLLHRFNLSNLKVGQPKDFFGCERDIMIVSSLRNSADESLGCLTCHNDNFVDLQMLRIVMSRSKRFLWLVGGMETLETTNDRTLLSLTRFFKGSSSTYKQFREQEDWKR